MIRPSAYSRRFTVRAWAIVLVMLVIVPRVASSETAGSKTLKDVVAEIADLVSDAAKSQNQATIRVTGFINPFDSKKGAGPGIRGLLIASLKERGIESRDDGASLALTGNYTASKGTDGKSPDEFPVAKIDYKLATESGKILLNSEAAVKGESPGYVTDVASVTEMAGSNVAVNPSKPQEATKKIVESLPSLEKTSTVVIEGTKVRPEKGSKFAVEILKAKLTAKKEAPPEDQFTPVMPTLRSGVPYVALEKDEVYLVRICNEQDFDVAAALSIDGLDMFHFSKEQKDRSRFWIFYKKTAPYSLVGWHIAGSEFNSFLIGEYSKEAAGKQIMDESKLSQISVEFRAAWQDEKDMPADEPKKGASLAVPFTVHDGPKRKKENKLVSTNIGEFRARVTIRYDHDYPDLPEKPSK